MRRRLFLTATFAAIVVRADTRQELIDLFGRIAAALSEGVPDAFLRAFDPSMPNYGPFAASVTALANQNDLSSSIEMVKQEGDDSIQVVELDWTLEIRGKDQNPKVVRRQLLVKGRVERRKKQWRIVSLDPQTFFAPP